MYQMVCRRFWRACSLEPSAQNSVARSSRLARRPGAAERYARSATGFPRPSWRVPSPELAVAVREEKSCREADGTGA
jgi:hypothetical protein